VIVDCAVYEDGRRLAGDLAIEDAYEATRDETAFAWIGLLNPTIPEFDSVRQEFDLHELAVEDAVHAHQRPKLEAYGDSLFAVLKTARLAEGDDVVKFGEILAFVGTRFVITVRHGQTALHEVRLELESRPDLLQAGPGAVLWAVVDRVVDDYLPVIDGLDQAVRHLEGDVFSSSRSNPAERIYNLKREVLELHDAVTPLLDPLDDLARGRYELVPLDVQPYFRDVHDHLLRVVDQVEGFRDLLTSVLTANLTQASVRQNEDVRRISAWAAIVAVPTAIAGIYGMNFEHLPGSGSRFGFALILAVIAASCIGLYMNFRRRGWL
jgi:magnesium transporter